MRRYLYGASVQGIQEFIFATNKLQEIVGASEIVKNIEEMFRDEINGMEVEVLVNAAGNIKAIFDDYESCQKVVMNFEKKVMQKAYGITISQSVKKLDSKLYTDDEMQALIEALKIQRNKPSIPLDMSINLMTLNPKTAKPVHSYRDDEVLDVATSQKRDTYTKWFNEKRKEGAKFKEFKEISTLSNSKNKVAVIHADGNGLGQLIPKLPELNLPLSEFSQKLDEATKKAFEDAKSEGMRIREVILGGDDMTVICDADDALEFTKNFLQHFESETEEKLGFKLTACAGIAYCNKKYPFHYAVSLAEELCSATKKHAKKIDEALAPSSLMFHNIQSANFQSWDRFIEDELTIQNDKQTIRCDFGPYYLDQANQPKIDKLQISVESYRCEGSPISRLRNWMGELHKSSEYAKNMLNRINEVTLQSGKWNCRIMDKNLENLYRGLLDNTLILQKDGMDKTPIYDILQILSATNVKGVA